MGKSQVQSGFLTEAMLPSAVVSSSSWETVLCHGAVTQPLPEGQGEGARRVLEVGTELAVTAVPSTELRYKKIESHLLRELPLGATINSAGQTQSLLSLGHFTIGRGRDAANSGREELNAERVTPCCFPLTLLA